MILIRESIHLLILFVLSFLAETTMTSEEEPMSSVLLNPREKVLVFGGNGFIGSTLVHNLILRNEFDIFLVSRGNWYFDSEERIKPFVEHIVCDRENSDLDFCSDLMSLVKENYFKFVFDFSTYKPEVLHESLELLNNKTDLYVYISSDSIYEVCEERRDLNNGFSRESDAVRPETEVERDRLNDLDEYGNEKLEGEEVLVANRMAGGCPYLILRLPDVIGQRDNTERIWTYIMWIQFYDFIKVPIFVPKHVQNLKTSYVYVNDVVRAIFHLIDKGIQDDVFNIAFDTVLTLQEFLHSLSVEIRQNVEFDFTAAESFNLFPSVSRGAVDINKLKNSGFIPTDFNLALHEIVDYYKEAFYTQESERDDVVHQLTKYVIGRDRKGEFLNYIDTISKQPRVQYFADSEKRTEL